MSVSQGEDRTGGRKYGKDWSTYQASGGYKALPDHRHREVSCYEVANSYQRKVGEVFETVRNTAKIDVAKGSWNRGGMHR